MFDRYEVEPYKRKPYLEGAREALDAIKHRGVALPAGWNVPHDGLLVLADDIRALEEALRCHYADLFAPTANELS